LLVPERSVKWDEWVVGSLLLYVFEQNDDKKNGTKKTVPEKGGIFFELQLGDIENENS
jgi:hypothetical protein